MVSMRRAAMRSPLRSSREMISPTRRRSTASGLQITRVRSAVVMAENLIRLGQRGPGRTDEVQRPGHHDLALLRGDLPGPGHGVLHGPQHLDPLGIDAELEGG